MRSIGNLLAGQHWQFDTVRHLFTLTVGVSAAGFVRFLTRNDAKVIGADPCPAPGTGRGRTVRTTPFRPSEEAR